MVTTVHIFQPNLRISFQNRKKIDSSIPVKFVERSFRDVIMEYYGNRFSSLLCLRSDKWHVLCLEYQTQEIVTYFKWLKWDMSQDDVIHMLSYFSEVVKGVLLKSPKR